MSEQTALTDFIQMCKHRIDQRLVDYLHKYDQNARLHAAMRYSLLNGGKRIRPTLVYASALAVNEINATCDVAAIAIEAIHAYSLIHDDLPAMDDDDLRRGQATCHIAFDEATAILAGDALQTLAFESICSAEVSNNLLRNMITTLASAAGANGMVAGQAIDLASEHQSVTLAELENMHQLKTGALFNASVRLGALSAGASEQQLQALANYSSAIGLAFQVQDDILDVTTDTQTLGKQQGADAALGKSTYVSLLGLEAAQEKANALCSQAQQALVGFNHRADYLRKLAAYIVERSH